MTRTRKLLVLLSTVALLALITFKLVTMGQVEVALAILLLVVIATLYITGNKHLANKIILRYVAEAERFWGSKTGQIKFEEVYARIMTDMPFFVRILFDEEDIRRMIDQALSTLNSVLQREQQLK